VEVAFHGGLAVGHIGLDFGPRARLHEMQKRHPLRRLFLVREA